MYSLVEYLNMRFSDTQNGMNGTWCFNQPNIICGWITTSLADVNVHDGQ